VSLKFLEIGKNMILEKEKGCSGFTNKAYFLGKMVWGKGYRELLDLWSAHKEELNDIQLDVFGNGEDSSAVREETIRHGLQINLFEGKDHADSSLHE
jgi:digalactosyldiacylglycerol synthase